MTHADAAQPFEHAATGTGSPGAAGAGYRHITVTPIAPSIGAEIGGVDLAAGVDEAMVTEIRRALLEHLVVFFRDQDIDAVAQKAFTRRFGDIFVHPNFNTGRGDPEIVELVRNPGDTSYPGEQWHSDTTMVAHPPMGAILYALEVPPYGNDTLFTNQYLAYETLSPGLKRVLEGMRAVHSDVRVAGPQARNNARRSTKVREDDAWRATESAHPVVRTHPETGRRALFVNIAYTLRFEDMSAEESAPLLDYLLAHGNRPEFSCRFAWRPGSIAFWDNRCTKHLALNDVGTLRRHMRRTQIAGDAVY
jgi:taurine dioxygenase